MKPGQVIVIRKDNRYKDGNIKKVNGVLRGNSKTVSMERMSIPLAAPLSMQLNPPIIVPSELGEMIRKSLNHAY